MLRPAIVALILLLGASLASAAPTADEKRARQLFESGETQYRLGNFEQALSDYEAALKLRRHPSIVFNIAQCHRQLGQTKKALFFYKLFLSDWEQESPGTDPPNLEEVQEHIQLLSAQLETVDRAKAASGDQTAATTQGKLLIEGLPDGACVMIDGDLKETAPLRNALLLPPGEHVVRIEAVGYAPLEQTIQLQAGEHQTIKPELVLVGGDSDGGGGRAKLWLISGITTGALAVGALGLGIGFNIKANNEKDVDEHNSARNISVTGYALTGVFAAASAASFILYYLATKPSEPSAAAAVFPTPGGALVTSAFRF